MTSKPTPRLSDDALQQLGLHAFPGNIRELRNILERARLFADDDLRNDLLERGRRRYRDEYSVDVLRQRFIDFLAPVL